MVGGVWVFVFRDFKLEFLETRNLLRSLSSQVILAAGNVTILTWLASGPLDLESPGQTDILYLILSFPVVVSSLSNTDEVTKFNS